jgi:hypothetical protein
MGNLLTECGEQEKNYNEDTHQYVKTAMESAGKEVIGYEQRWENQFYEYKTTVEGRNRTKVKIWQGEMKSNEEDYKSADKERELLQGEKNGCNKWSFYIK